MDGIIAIVQKGEDFAALPALWGSYIHFKCVFLTYGYFTGVICAREKSIHPDGSDGHVSPWG